MYFDFIIFDKKKNKNRLMCTYILYCMWVYDFIFYLQVYFSHHKPELIEKEFPKNVVHTSDVEFFSEKSVYFKDNTKHTFDAIIYCTGKCMRK